jgi:pyruvate/2-oxoglutarate/acetoin dehydrogenase E1 component
MVSSESKLGIEPEVLERIYVQIARIHAVDEAIKSGLAAGKFVFTYWPMTGQEAIPATLSQLVSREDYMVTIYRGIHDLVAKGVPLTIRTICAGGVGGLGAQHSQSLEAWALHIPGLKVAFPSTPAEAKGLLLSCIFDEDPCIHIEPMALINSVKEAVPLGDYRIPLGVAKVKRAGTDITLISYGPYVPHCLAVAETLAAQSISCEVLDLRTLMPLDYVRVLDSVKKTRRALVVHLATEFCGLGAEIAQTINEEEYGRLRAPASRLGAEYVPIAYSRVIEQAQVPTREKIAERVRQLMKY